MRRATLSAMVLMIAFTSAPSAQPYEVRYTPAGGRTPDLACPSWNSLDRPGTAIGGVLRMATTTNSQNVIYSRMAPDISIPAQLVIEFRCKFISGSTSHPARAPIAVNAVTAPTVGTLFSIGQDDIFLNSAHLTRGPTATVQTDDAFHTYRLVISGSGVEVYYDGALTLTGSTYANLADFGNTPLIDWGEGSNGTFGVSDWEYFQHNASPVLCGPCVTPPAGLVGWWPGDGNALDLAGGNPGTLVGGASFAAGRVGPGFHFDSDDDRVTIPHNPILDVQPSGFAADFWMQGVKNQPDPSLATLLEKSHGWTDNTGWAFQVFSSTGQAAFAIGDGAGFPNITGSIDVLDGNPHHIAGTWDGSTMWLYVDGVLQGTALNASPANNTRPVNIGFTWGGGTPRRFLRGIVDEVEVFDRALPASEIQSIVASGASGKCKSSDPSGCVPAPSGLVGWWPGDGNANSIVGTSGGTLQNGAMIAAGKVGQAFDLDGLDDIVRVPSVASFEVQQFTVDAWAFARSTGYRNDAVGGIVVTKDIGNTFTPPFTSWTLTGPGSTGKFHAFVGLTDGSHPQLTSTSSFAFNQFHHVAATWDGGLLKLYVNGQLEGTLNIGMKTVFYSGEPLTIGDHNLLPAQRAFNGLIDEVEIFNRTLSAAEIAAIVNAGAAGKCKDGGPPTVTAPDDASYQCAAQVPAATAAQATTTDDEGVASLTVTEASNGGAGSPASPLVITRTWTATDGAGNSATDSQAITVIDNTPPALSTPADVATATGPGTEPCAQVRLALATGSASATDNCSTPTVGVSGVPDGGLYPVGETLLIWTATDAAGNAVRDTQRVVVACPVGDLVGSVSLLCNGQTEPAANVTVRLLHEGSPFRSTTTSPAGDYRFDDNRQGTYTVAIEAPPGYAVAPDTRLVSLDQAEKAVNPFVLTCLLSDLTGQVNGTCNGQTRGLQGVTVDVFRDDGHGMDVLVATAATDGSGIFRFDDLALGEYTVGIVLPLGYSTGAASQTVTLVTPDGSVAAPAFALTCQTIAAQPRSMGYWKHQVNVYLTGKGSAQETLAQLLGYIDALVEHFNENLVNPVIVYVPNSTNTQDKLLQLQQLLTVNRGGTMLDRAKQELLALLLNVISGKISQTEVIGNNGATVSQAITYSHDLIVDGLTSNDETAKTICDLINNGQRLPSGVVPATTRVITYDWRPAPQDPPAPVAFGLGPFAPNPATENATIAFALPTDAPAWLEVVDLAGRMVKRQEVGSQGAGRHSVRLADLGRMRPGVYLVRLSQGREALIRRIAVIR